MGGGGMFGPMDMSRSGARVLMQPDTGVGFKDVVGVDNAKLVSSRLPCSPLTMNRPSHDEPLLPSLA